MAPIRNVHLSAISSIIWVTAGLLFLALTGYRFWDTYTQRQASYAFMQRIEQRSKVNALTTERELARWKRLNDKLERRFRVPLQLQYTAPSTAGERI